MVAEKQEQARAIRYMKFIALVSVKDRAVDPCKSWRRVLAPAADGVSKAAVRLGACLGVAGVAYTSHLLAHWPSLHARVLHQVQCGSLFPDMFPTLLNSDELKAGEPIVDLLLQVYGRLAGCRKIQSTCPEYHILSQSAGPRNYWAATPGAHAASQIVVDGIVYVEVRLVAGKNLERLPNIVRKVGTLNAPSLGDRDRDHQ